MPSGQEWKSSISPSGIRQCSNFRARIAWARLSGERVFNPLPSGGSPCANLPTRRVSVASGRELSLHVQQGGMWWCKGKNWTPHFLPTPKSVGPREELSLHPHGASCRRTGAGLVDAAILYLPFLLSQPQQGPMAAECPPPACSTRAGWVSRLL